MASKAQFEVDADTEGAVQAIENIGRAAQSATKDVKALEAEQKRAAQSAQREAEKSAQALEKVGKGAIGALDKATGGLIGKFTGLFKDIKQVNLGFKGMKAAIAATGIGLLVVALGEIAANWENITAFLNSASKSSQDLLKSTTDNAAAQQVKLDAISEQENILKAQGKTEAEIRDLKKAQTAETITALEAQILAQESVKTAQIDAAERNKQILQGIIRAITLPLSLLLGTIDMVGKALGQDFGLEEKFSGGLANMVFNPEEIAIKGGEAIAETKKQLTKLKNAEAGFTLQANKEKSDAEAKAAQARFDALNKELQAAELLRQKFEDNAEAKRIAKLAQDKIDRKFLVDFEHDADMEAFQNSLKDLEKRKKIGEERTKLLQDEADAAEKIEQAKEFGRQANLQNLEDTIGNLGSLFAEGTAASKAAAIAQIAIGTGVGFINGLGIAQESAKATGPAAAFAFPLFYAAQIASVLAAANQAKKILATAPGGSSPPNISPPSVPSAPNRPPQFNIVGRSDTNQLATSIAGQGIVQAYVVGSEVTTQQALDRKRVRTATFG